MIYFVYEDRYKAMKIGFTEVDISQRLSGLQVGCPGKLRLIALIEGGKRNEKYFHTRLQEYCVSGEWFDVTQKEAQDVILRTWQETHKLENADDFWQALEEMAERTRMIKFLNIVKKGKKPKRRYEHAAKQVNAFHNNYITIYGPDE